MKLSADRKALSDAAKDAAKFLPRMSHLAVLEHLHLEAHSNQLMVSATNLSAGRTVEVEADIETDGRILVPANFAQIAAKAQGPTLTLEATIGDVSISDGVSKWKLQLGQIEDYPNIDPAHKTEAEVDSWQHIRAVASAAGGTKPELQGVHFGDGFACATDSYRMAWTEMEAPEALVPAYAIRSLDTNVSALRIGERHVSAVLEDGIWWSRRIDGKFPNWQRLIPTDPPVAATVSTEALTDALARAAIISPIISKGSNRWQVVALEVGDGITVRSGDDFSEIVEADTDGEMTAYFNVGYLTDAFTPVDKATLRLTDEYKPLLIESGWLNALIMPIRQ